MAEPLNDLPGPRDIPTLATRSVKLPAHFDWRDLEPSVSLVFDQKSCGACWAIATATCLSDRAAIATSGAPPRFSPLELMVGLGRCRGCARGCSVAEALRFVRREGLADARRASCELLALPERSASRSWPSEDDARGVLACLAGSRRYRFGEPADAESCEGLKREIYERGPVVATFNLLPDFLTGSDPSATSRPFEGTGGIYEHREGGEGQSYGYHAVVIVGWGRAPDGRSYWEIRNSWGEAWGDRGFFRAAMSEQPPGVPRYNAGLGFDVPGVQVRGGREVQIGGAAYCAVLARSEA